MAKTSSSTTMRTLFLSMVAIVLCALLLVTGTYALFTDSVSVKNHLQAGTMKLQLWRVGLENTMLNENGVLETQTPNTTPVNFTETTNENVFGLVDGDTIVPETVLKATMELRNTNTVAFTYYIEIVPTKVDEQTESDPTFWSQLTVSVTANGQVYDQFDTTDGVLRVGSETVGVNTVFAGTEANPTTEQFTITVKFNDAGAANNDAQGKKVAFDLIVYAVQAVA